jgi:hypothetical protein
MSSSAGMDTAAAGAGASASSGGSASSSFGSSGRRTFYGPSLAPSDMGDRDPRSTSTGGHGVGSGSCTTSGSSGGGEEGGGSRGEEGPGTSRGSSSPGGPVLRGDGVFSGLACIVDPLVLLTSGELQSLPSTHSREVAGASGSTTLSSRACRRVERGAGERSLGMGVWGCMRDVGVVGGRGCKGRDDGNDGCGGWVLRPCKDLWVAMWQAAVVVAGLQLCWHRDAAVPI